MRLRYRLILPEHGKPAHYSEKPRGTHQSTRGFETSEEMYTCDVVLV